MRHDVGLHQTLPFTPALEAEPIAEPNTNGDPSVGRPKGPICAHFETIEKIRSAFELGGIEFIGNPNPGVRLRSEAKVV